MNNLFWRQTKQSVKDEYQIPPVLEDLILLDLTDIEKASHTHARDKDSTYFCSIISFFSVIPFCNCR